jgi:hypothetical protein
MCKVLVAIVFINLLILPQNVISNPVQFKLGLHECNTIISHSKEMTGSDAGLFGFQFGFENFLDSSALLSFNGDYVTTQRYPFPIRGYDNYGYYSAVIFSTQFCIRKNRLQCGGGLQWTSYSKVADLSREYHNKRVFAYMLGFCVSSDFRIYKFIHLAASYCPSIYNINDNRFEYSHTAFLSILLRTPKYMVGPIAAERARY